MKVQELIEKLQNEHPDNRTEEIAQVHLVVHVFQGVIDLDNTRVFITKEDADKYEEKLCNDRTQQDKDENDEE